MIYYVVNNLVFLPMILFLSGKISSKAEESTCRQPCPVVKSIIKSPLAISEGEGPKASKCL